MSVGNPPEARNDCQDFRFKLMCRLKVFQPGDVSFSADVSLVAAASRFGLIFVGCPSGMQVIRTSSLAAVGSGSVRGDLAEFPRRVVPLPSEATHLGVSCDQSYLAAVVRKDSCPHAYIYSVPSFLSQNVGVACEVRLSTSPNNTLTGLAWNPGVMNVLACCLSDGSAGVFELKPGGVEINTLPPEAQAKCLSWSPKGKQLVVGDRAGALTQYKPDLKAVKKLPPPSLEDGQLLSLINVVWLSNYQFAAVYMDRSDRQSLMIVNTSKSGEVSFVNYEDICYSSANFRPAQFYIIHQATWNILMVGSANSTEVGILGMMEDQVTWQQWIQEDEARAELPYQSVGVRQETFPVGMAFDTSWQDNLPWGDNQVLPPMPLLILLSHQGLLCVFHTINLRPGSAVLCTPPEIPQDQSGLHLFTTPQVVAQPQNLSQQLSKSPMQVRPQQQPQLQPQQQPQLQPQQQPQQQPQLQPQQQPQLQPQQQPQLQLQQQSQLQPQQQPQLQPQQQPQLQPQQQPQQQSQQQMPQPQQQMHQPQQPLQQQQQQSQQQPQQSWFANTSFPNARANLSQKFEEVAPATASNASSFGGKSTFSFGSGFSLLPTGGSSPGSSGTKTLFGGAEQKTSPAAPVAVFGAAQQTASTQGSAGFSFSLANLNQQNPAGQTEQPQASSVAPPPVIMKMPPASRYVAEPEPVEERTVLVDEEARTMVLTAIKEELEHFQEEMSELRARTSSISCQIGSDEEQAALRAGPEKLLAFCRELKSTTLGQAAEIQELKGMLLETFAWMEDARSRLQLQKNPSYIHLTQLRTLDHINVIRSQEMDNLADYIEGQLREVNRCLDAQWAEFQQSNSKKRMQIPTLEAVYRTMVTHHSILSRQMALVQRLLARLPDTKKQQIGSVPLIMATRDEAEKELSELAEALVTNLKVSDTLSNGFLGIVPPATYSRPLSAVKQNKLRDFFQHHPVVRVASTRAAPISSATFAPTSFPAVLNKSGGITSGIPVFSKTLDANTPKSTGTRQFNVGSNGPQHESNASFMTQSTSGTLDYSKSKIVFTQSPESVANIITQNFTSPVLPKSKLKEPEPSHFPKNIFSFSQPTDVLGSQVSGSNYSITGSSLFSKPTSTSLSKNKTPESETTKLQADSKTADARTVSAFTFSPSPMPPVAVSSPKVADSSLKPQKSSLSSLSDIVASICEPAHTEDKLAGKPANNASTIFGNFSKPSTVFKTVSTAQSSSEMLGSGPKPTFSFAKTLSSTDEKAPLVISFGSGNQIQEKATFQTNIFGGSAKVTSASSESNTSGSVKLNVSRAPIFGLSTPNFSVGSPGVQASPKEPATPNITVVSTTIGDSVKETLKESNEKVESECKTDTLDQSVPLFGNLSLNSSSTQDTDAFRSLQSTVFSTPVSERKIESSVLQTPATTPPPEPAESIPTEEKLSPVSPAVSLSAEVAAVNPPNSTDAVLLPKSSSSDTADMTEKVNLESSMSSFSFAVSSQSMTTPIAEVKPQTSVEVKTSAPAPVTAISPNTPLSDSKSLGSTPATTFSFTLPTTSTASPSAFAPKSDSDFSQSTATKAQMTTEQITATSTSAASFFGQPICSPSSFGQSSGSIFGQAAGKASVFTPTTSIFGQAPTPSIFGQASPSGFAQTGTGSIFGNSSTTATTTSSVFGQATTSTPLFGQAPTSSSSMFGQAPSSTPSLFGQVSTTTTTTTSSTFGQTPTTTPLFGQTPTSTSLFGQAPASTPSIFGQAQSTTPSMFGTPQATTSSLFGQTAATTTAAAPALFGQTLSASSFFGSSGPFGQSTGSVFGQASKPAFGSSGGSIFGGGSSPAFSTPGATTSGSPFQSGSGSVFGAGSGAFNSGGNSSVGQTGFGTSPFSQPKPGGFGSPPVFGQPGASTFGSSPTFGASPTFGGAPTFSSSPKVFGNTSPTIGTVTGFGGTAQAPSAFENMASQNTMTFGNLAQGQGQTQGFGSSQQSVFGNTQQSTPAFSGSSTFGGSSFSSWR